jgi:phosphoglycolate phosphatase
LKAILFDLDGTLIDSGDDLANSVNYMLKKLNKKTFDNETIKKWIGNGAAVLVKRALSGGMEIKDINEEEFQKAFEIFMNHYSENLCVNTKLFDGVREVLEYLKDKKLAIITNKPYKFVLPILEYFKIDEYFDLVLGGDSLDEKKPSAKPLKVACERLGVLENEAVMVGDSKNDIIAAKNAGIRSVCVTYGYLQGEEAEKLGADFVINSLKELKECKCLR